MGSAVGSIGGGIVGAYFGGPAGAAVGSQIGGQLLGSADKGGNNQAGSAQQAAAIQAQAAQQAGLASRFYGGQAQSLQQQMQQLSQSQLQNAYSTASNQMVPYSNVGLNALDQLAQLTGTAVPNGGSLNNNYLNQYNTLQNELTQLNSQNAQNQKTWNGLLSGGYNTLDERNSLQGNIDATTQRQQQIQNQLQNLMANAPDALKQQLQNNYNQTINYDAATAYGANNPNNLTNPGQASLGNLASTQATSSNPLGGFANSAQAALIGGYDPNKGLLGNFYTQPGYQFQQQQGQQALLNQAAAKGLMGSAPMAKSLLDYSQGLADQSFQQYLGNLGTAFNSYQGQLQNMAGNGFNAAANTGQYAMNTGSNLANINTNYANQGANNYQETGANVANSILAGGAAQAGGIINAANAAAVNQAGNAGLGSLIGGQLGPSLFGASSNSGSTINGSSIPQPSFDMSAFGG